MKGNLVIFLAIVLPILLLFIVYAFPSYYYSEGKGKLLLTNDSVIYCDTLITTGTYYMCNDKYYVELQVEKIKFRCFNHWNLYLPTCEDEW